MADFDENIDQLNYNQFPTYMNSDRVSGLQVNFISEANYIEPWTLQDFKDHARIDFDTDDNLLELYLKASRIDVEEYLQKSLGIRSINLLALKLPKNYKLPFGPVQSISGSSFTLFGDILVEGGEDVNIEYLTNASLVNTSIIQSIYKQALNYYENRDSVQPSGLDSITKVILNPYKEKTLL